MGILLRRGLAGDTITTKMTAARTTGTQGAAGLVRELLSSTISPAAFKSLLVYLACRHAACAAGTIWTGRSKRRRSSHPPRISTYRQGPIAPPEQSSIRCEARLTRSKDARSRSGAFPYRRFLRLIIHRIK
jgi:hypothetical protein